MLKGVRLNFFLHFALVKRLCVILAILLKGVRLCKEALRSAGNTTEGLTFRIALLLLQ